MKKNKKRIIFLSFALTFFTVFLFFFIHTSVIAAGTASTMPSYGTPTMKVVDISQYNDSIYSNTDNINFAVLRTQVDAVYIRALGNAGTGLYVDKQATYYAASAQNNGLKFGFYLYYIPTSDLTNARSQAQAFYSFIKNYGYSCVPVLDVENNDNGLTKAQLAAAVKTFVDEFSSLSRLDIMIYSYPYFMSENFDTTFSWSSYKLWIAHYNVAAPMEGISSTWMPQSKWCWQYWDMWQYTSTGVLTSVPCSAGGQLDLSYATDNILLAAPTSAEITSIILSDSITAGGPFSAQITVKNTDKVAWTESTNIRLGINGTASGFSRAFLPYGVSVSPGASYTFVYTGTAPASGDLSLNVQMLKESVTWFGETKSVTVKAKDAKIVATNIPTVILAGQTQDMQVEIKNTGLFTWTEADNIRLFIGIGGADCTRAFLPAGVRVTPGASYKFIFHITAPASSGNLALSIQMVQECVTMFGEGKTQIIAVTKPTSAEITSINLTDSIKSGDPFTLTATVKNTGTIVWTDRDNIRLGITGAVTARGYLPAGVSVAPGASYTFIYTGTAPEIGDLVLRIQMLQECMTWFGEVKSITVKAKDAKIVATNIPTEILAGQTQEIQVEMKNTGLSTWTEVDNIRLFIGINGADYTRAFLPAGVSVAPGASYKFAFSITAPASSGNLALSVQMVQECVTMFGDGKTQIIAVTKPTSAEITSINLTDSIKSGDPFTLTATVKNTGTIIWTDRDNIRLGITGTVTARGYLPAGVSVAPGDSYTFFYAGTAPASGDLLLNVQMLKECVTWFGEVKSVTVKAKDAKIVVTNIPTVLLAGQTQEIQVEMKNTGLSTWTEADNIRLFIGINGADYTRAFLPAGVSVAPGASYKFAFSITAPASSGNLALSVQMVQECVTMFGEGKTQIITI